jgi:hypothetical protein
MSGLCHGIGTAESVPAREVAAESRLFSAQSRGARHPEAAFEVVLRAADARTTTARLSQPRAAEVAATFAANTVVAVAAAAWGPILQILSLALACRGLADADLASV